MRLSLFVRKCNCSPVALRRAIIWGGFLCKRARWFGGDEVLFSVERKDVLSVARCVGAGTRPISAKRVDSEM